MESTASTPPHRRERAVNRRVQGDIGELSAMEWLASKGAVVWVPFTHSPHVDLTAELNDERSLALGGTKYSEFEIEPGTPFEGTIYSRGDPNRILACTAGECQSGQMEQTVNLPAMPTQVRILPPPSNSRQVLLRPKRQNDHP